MDTTEQNENELESVTPETGEPGEGELSHSDKMIGVFSEPGKMFDITSKFPPRHKDWVIPIILFCVIAIVINFVLLQNAELKFQFEQMINKKVNEVEQQLEEKVKSGEMTEAEKERALEGTRQGIAFMSGPVMRSVTTIVFTFIGFFFMALLYFLFSKLVLKGNGNYAGALIARGLPIYILTLQLIIIAILSMVMSKLFLDTSVASFTNTDANSLAGYFLNKIDPFAIWFYSIVAIALSKFFKSSSVTKYFILVFAIWFIGDAIFKFFGFGVG